MYFPSWEKIASLKHYTRSGLVVSTVSFALILLLICFGLPAELAFSEMILIFFGTAALVAHLFSNATYIAGTIDLFEAGDPKTTTERWMTLAGLVAGLIGGIALALTLPSLSFFTFLGTTSVTIGAMAGLGNRFGGIMRRPRLERYALITSSICGVIMSACILYLGVPLIHVTGVISFMTAGPPLIASGIFVCLVTSLFMSGADYFSKALLYLPRIFKKDKEPRHHEYEGSFFGALFSIAAIIFFMTHLHLLVGFHLSITGFNMIATTVSLFAKCFGIDGICSRIGRTLDEFLEKEDTAAEKCVKVGLVVSGIAGLMVLADICFKIKNYLQPTIIKNAIAAIPDIQPATHARLALKFNYTPSPLMLSMPTAEEEKKEDRHIVSTRNPALSLNNCFLLLWECVRGKKQSTFTGAALVLLSQHQKSPPPHLTHNVEVLDLPAARLMG